jgi:CDGSH-type Zn-finger protein
MNMNKPVRASDTPYVAELEADKTYFWCACGLSKKQPFCDGSHKDSTFTPVKYQPAETKKVFLCGCKLTNTPPICDGSHKSGE